MISKVSFHEQSWCDTCQDSERTCNGDHTSEIIGTPLTGSGWLDTDHGVEIPRIDIYAVWEEGFDADSAIPAVYVGAISPAILPHLPSPTVQGYLNLEMAERLRDSLDKAIAGVKLTLSANHHLICDCGEDGD